MLQASGRESGSQITCDTDRSASAHLQRYKISISGMLEMQRQCLISRRPYSRRYERKRPTRPKPFAAPHRSNPKQIATATWHLKQTSFKNNGASKHVRSQTTALASACQEKGGGRCRANSTHVRQKRPDSGFGLQKKVPTPFFRCSLFAWKQGGGAMPPQARGSSSK